MWKLGLRPGNICFEISVFCLCSAVQYRISVGISILYDSDSAGKEKNRIDKRQLS
jgi:hypothetical protein